MATTTNIRRAAIPLLTLLILTYGFIPLAAAAPITLTPSKTTYNPGNTLTVSGTATPNTAVTVQVKNPAGKLIAIGQGNADSTGAYSITIFTWPLTPTLDIPLGTFSITATDAATGESTSTTVEYAQLVVEAPEEAPGAAAEALVQITVSTSATYQLGETARISALFSFNGEKVDPTTTVFLIHTPGLTTIARSLIKIHQGLYYVDFTPTEKGTYIVHVEGAAEGTTNVGITTFQVIDPVATQTGLTALSNDVAEISTTLSSVQQSILNRIDSAQSSLSSAISDAQSDIKSTIESARSSLSSAISSAQSSLSSAISSAKSDLDSRIGSAQSDIKMSISAAESSIKSQVSSSEQAIKAAVDGVQSAVTSAVTSAIQPLQEDIGHVDEAVDALQEDIGHVDDAVDALESNLESTEAGVSAASTWIIVVGIIAAITLVLELVILIRKLS